MILNRHIREYLQLFGIQSHIQGMILPHEDLTTYPKSREVLSHVVR